MSSISTFMKQLTVLRNISLMRRKLGIKEKGSLSMGLIRLLLDRKRLKSVW